MFTSFVLRKSSAGEGRGREGEGGKETARKLVPDEGMLKTRRVVHSAASREAAENGGGSVLCPIPSLLLFRSDPHRLACPCTRALCVLYVRVRLHVCVRAFVGGPTYRRLLATLFHRAPTGWHAAHISPSTRCIRFYRVSR